MVRRTGTTHPNKSPVMISTPKLATLLFLSICLSSNVALGGDPVRRVPSVDDLLQIESLSGAAISPDGKRVIYGVTQTDFKQDSHITHLWLADRPTGRAIQLTRGEKSAGNPAWSPDSHWVAFTSERAGDKAQIFVIPPDGGEAVQLTKAESGVINFAWSPDGKTIAFTAAPLDKDAVKDRKEHFGDYEI